MTARESLVNLGNDDARAVWRLADKYVAEAAVLENEARRLRSEAERLNRLAVDVADGNIGRSE